MSEAPERMVLQPCPTYGWDHPDRVIYAVPPASEYVHVDVSHALVAAALREAAFAAFRACKATGAGYRDGNERLLQRAENEMRLETQKAIRAIITPDASAALDRVRAEARREGIERAAEKRVPELEERVEELEARLAAAVDAMNQSRLAFAGYVSAQSAVNKLDNILVRIGESHE